MVEDTITASIFMMTSTEIMTDNHTSVFGSIIYLNDVIVLGSVFNKDNITFDQFIEPNVIFVEIVRGLDQIIANDSVVITNLEHSLLPRLRGILFEIDNPELLDPYIDDLFKKTHDKVSIGGILAIDAIKEMIDERCADYWVRSCTVEPIQIVLRIDSYKYSQTMADKFVEELTLLLVKVFDAEVCGSFKLLWAGTDCQPIYFKVDDKGNFVEGVLPKSNTVQRLTHILTNTREFID